MFKNEINLITDYYLNKKSVDNITLKQLKNCGIHPAIIKYTSAAIDKIILLDRKRSEENSICDYKSEKLKKYFKLIEVEIKLNQVFDEKDINQILQDAIIFNVQYLTQPNYALTNFVFGNSKIKSIEEIHNSLSHVYYYQFLQKVIYKYLNEKKTLEIERKEFVSLLNKIEKISNRKYLSDSLASAINSISDFFDIKSEIPELLQISSIKLFLEEKRLPKFIDIIESQYGNDTNRLINSKELIAKFNAAIIETELLIKETDSFEDDIAENYSEEIIITDSETEEHAEYVTENIEENIGIISDEILDIDSNEVEIQNNEILSSDEIVEYKEEEFSISKDEDVLEASEILEPIDLANIEKDNIDNSEVNVENNKETISNSILKDLVDLNPIYESLLSPMVPFANWESEFNPTNSFDDSSAEIGYQLDPSSVSEEIDISPNTNADYLNIESKNIELSEENISENNKVEEIEWSSESLLNNKILDAELDLNIEQSEIPDNNIVADENFMEDAPTESNDVPIGENETSFNEEENLVVNNSNNEEMTEVFTDLAFLDYEPTSSNPEDSILNGEETTEEVENSVNIEETESNSDYSHNFSDMVASKDMTKIIECIFDYDMEDYHSMLNHISNSENESKASEIVLEYCKANHVELTAKEIDLFQFLISEYFTQAYS